MGKRRLSLQQRRRIAAGRSHSVAAPAPGEAAMGERHGLVAARYGKAVDVLDTSAPGQAVQRCHLRAHLEPVVGDRVLWLPGDADGLVTALAPRQNMLRRRERTGVRVLAANIDQIVLVLAPQPEPHAALADRFLAAAEIEGISALLVINKGDLPGREKVEAIAEARARLGYAMVRVSAYSGLGLDTLRQHLEGRVSVFCGQSGVGKSSLINRVFPAANAAVGQLSAAAVKGRHTTTVARFYPLPGGAVIDSPGIREFDVPCSNAAELIRGFVELRVLAQHCRFRNCRHRDDPDCAVAAAIAQGTVDRERLASFHQLLQPD